MKVLVTGAGGFVGSYLLPALVERGHSVVATDLRLPGDAVATEAVHWIALDVSRPEECDALVAAAVAEFGRLDVLVNMASVYRAVPFDRMTADDFQAALDVDLKAAFLCARAAVPHMKAGGGGRIVNIADWLAASRRPRYKGYLGYYVAKAAVIGLTEALALELAEDQILVNAVAPGPILAPPDLPEDEFAAVEKATPLGRWGGAGAIAQAVAALVESDFITGETVRVDGGRHLR